MYKYWISFTTFSILFFLICLTLVIFRNEPIFGNFWEEGLLLVSIANLALALNYYRQHKEKLVRKRGKVDHK